MKLQFICRRQWTTEPAAPRREKIRFEKPKSVSSLQGLRSKSPS